MTAANRLRSERVDAASLSESARIDALVVLQQLQAWVDAQAVRLLAAMDVGTELDRDLAATEVGVALRQPPATVHDRLRAAHELADRLPRTLAMVEAGWITYRHASALVDAVAGSTDEVAARVEELVLERAPCQSVAAFRRAVRRAVLAVDPETARRRREDAEQGRRVHFRPAEDGMGELWALLPADGMALLRARLDAEASRLLPGDDRTRDQRRADALVALAEQGLLDDAVPFQQGRRPVIQLTIAASTLLGEDDRPGDLDGYGPLDAAAARALAFDPSGTWRRLITGPDGYLMDYGRETYRPAQALRDFTAARDRTCRFPGCAQPARRCDFDHQKPWPDGRTSADNGEFLCEHHHRLKHRGGWTVTGNPNDMLRWRSPTGHTYYSPPHDYG